jgi:hypothetical protein
MKQTAVEWLEAHLIEYGFDLSLHKFELKQAKEMEKEHICNAYKEGNHSEMRGGKFINPIADEYYNQTYKSE